MPYYEIIFETGEVAVACYEDDDEALAAAKAQHDRAVAGGVAGPAGGSATRVKRILRYEDHPGDYRASGQLDATELKKEVNALVKAMTDPAGEISVMKFAEEVKSIVHPMVAAEGPHDSRFKAKEAAELEWEG